jgi:stalled ribosome alternative rescue factor ArfA
MKSPLEMHRLGRRRKGKGRYEVNLGEVGMTMGSGFVL